ncbi:maleylpyruvate isomerase family mycothiol-dependent enzyme [Crossiella cryophila]|uniref:Uncharacterized protein (TIGR03083 family) n=1 Tax=Crossiella cryophila TaxID=43355 RepID=A0A7W7FV83_9PSEU|nr:maleylpyruvate isomerase family mycothiol-dependent enzyme [Crossiella cryophila]MBB4679027.1 uncharacterized protein (TIGR03083 family) [Crossiella cryophila]
MDRDQILDWTCRQRLRLADFLESLPEAEWQSRSLCPEWTVYEVAAHMTISTRMTFGGLVKAAIRARGDFDRMEATLAIERAARFTPAELIVQVREHAGSAKRTPGSGLLDPLTDALVHAQDIARPLGRVLAMPVEPTVPALEHVMKSPFYGARKRFRGMRLVATDVEWTSGEGADEVRGPVGELLLLATGRAAGLAGLTGAGAERLASAFAQAGQ